MKIRMWVFSLMVLAVVGLLLNGAPVQAGGGPGKIVFKDTKSFAPAPFNHDTHKKAGTGCDDCHDALFKKKAGSTDEGNALTMKALRKGKYCGSCHDGKQAFSSSKN